MILFQLNKEILSPLDPVKFNLERDIQNIVEANVEEIFNLQLVFSEYKLKDFRFDSVCFDNETNSFVIIEYKKDYSFSIVDQGFSYLSMMLERKSDLVLDHNEKTGNNLKKNEVDWSQSKIIFISQSFTPHQINSINFKDMPFELWEIKRFSNDVIGLNQFAPSSKDSVKGLTTNKVISRVNQEIKAYDANDLISKCSTSVKSLWSVLHQKIIKSDFLGTKFITKKNYIRFSYDNNQGISYFNFRKKFIKVDILSGTIFGDGTKGKYFAEIDDYKNLTKKNENVWTGYGQKYNKDKYGTNKDAVNISYRFDLDNEKDINYLIELMKMRYDAITKNAN